MENIKAENGWNLVAYIMLLIQEAQHTPNRIKTKKIKIAAKEGMHPPHSALLQTDIQLINVSTDYPTTNCKIALWTIS